MVSTLQYRRCAWLMHIIHVHQPITREQINEYWRNEQDDKINANKTSEIPLRTFQKTIHMVEDLFDADITCNRHTNEYSIQGKELAGISRTRKLSNVDVAKMQLKTWSELNIPEQLFRIDALPDTAERLREHPICPEQREVSVDEKSGITIFEYLMKPTWEWYEAIRSLGAAVKVIYPYWLSELVREDALGVANMYKEEKDRRLASPGFINPYNCRIVDTNKSSLYLSIPWEFYEALKEGELEEYNVAITPENAWHLVKMDVEKCEPLRDEEDNMVPVEYDTIHFKISEDSDAPEAIVEVTKAESFILTDVKEEDKTEEDPMEEVITYTIGKLLQTWEQE